MTFDLQVSQKLFVGQYYRSFSLRSPWIWISAKTNFANNLKTHDWGVVYYVYLSLAQLFWPKNAQNVSVQLIIFEIRPKKIFANWGLSSISTSTEPPVKYLKLMQKTGLKFEVLKAVKWVWCPFSFFLMKEKPIRWQILKCPC